MTIRFDTAWLVAVMLVAMRLGVFLTATPIFSAMRMPPQVRVLVSISLATALVAGMGVSSWVAPQTSAALFFAVLIEAAIGAVLAFGVMTTFAALLFGGRLLDLQIGFGIASLYDPVTRAASPLLGTALNMMGILVFLALDGHHELMRALALSLETAPPGGGWPNVNFAAIVAQFGAIFSMGLALAAPVVFGLLILDMALAILSRTMPQMNIFFVSMPLRIATGLILLALSLHYVGPLLKQLFASMSDYLRGVLGG